MSEELLLEESRKQKWEKALRRASGQNELLLEAGQSRKQKWEEAMRREAEKRAAPPKTDAKATPKKPGLYTRLDRILGGILPFGAPLAIGRAKPQETRARAKQAASALERAVFAPTTVPRVFEPTPPSSLLSFTERELSRAGYTAKDIERAKAPRGVLPAFASGMSRGVTWGVAGAGPEAWETRGEKIAAGVGEAIGALLPIGGLWGAAERTVGRLIPAASERLAARLARHALVGATTGAAYEGGKALLQRRPEDAAREALIGAVLFGVGAPAAEATRAATTAFPGLARRVLSGAAAGAAGTTAALPFYRPEERPTLKDIALAAAQQALFEAVLGPRELQRAQERPAAAEAAPGPKAPKAEPQKARKTVAAKRKKEIVPPPSVETYVEGRMEPVATWPVLEETEMVPHQIRPEVEAPAKSAAAATRTAKKTEVPGSSAGKPKYRTAASIPDEEIVRIATQMSPSMSPTNDLVKAVRDRLGVSENVAAKAVKRVLERGLLKQEEIRVTEASPAGSFNIPAVYTRWIAATGPAAAPAKVYPQPGKSYHVRMTSTLGRFKEGQEFTGTVERVFRAKSGAFLAELRQPDGSLVVLPGSKYAEWRPVETAPEAPAPEAKARAASEAAPPEATQEPAAEARPAGITASVWNRMTEEQRASIARRIWSESIAKRVAKQDWEALSSAERELIAKEPAPEPVSPTPRAPAVLGRGSTAKTDRGTAVETQFAVVEAGDLISSHNEWLRPDERFPKELQPRERTRQASELQIQHIAAHLEPEFLAESPRASEGAPIVGPDLVVESGNARVIALKRLYAQGHENAEKYRNWLVKNAERFGLDPEQVMKLKRPVLVRVRRSDVDRVKFTREANEASVAAMSATEQALADAERISPQLLGMLEIPETGELLSPANAEFLRAFLREVVSPSELGRYLTADGSISQEGLTRIRNALFARAYGDPEVLVKLAESTDSNIRNITNALLSAAPRLARIKDLAGRGEVFDLDITGELAEAAKLLSRIRYEGRTVRGFLQQGRMFEEEPSPLVKEFLNLFEKYGRSAKKLSSILHEYALIAEAAGSPKQMRLFDAAPPTKAEVLEAAIRKAGVAGEAERVEGPSLFGDEAAGGPVAAGAGKEAGEGAGAAEAVERAQKAGKVIRGKAKKGLPPTAGPQQAPAGASPAARPVKRLDVVRYLEQKLLVPIRSGRLSPGQAAGQYDVRQEVIRTRRAEDLRAIAHEVGHHLTKRLRLDPRKYPELQKIGAKLYPQETADVQMDEGMAEFFYYWLNEPALAQKEAPAFYRDFEAVLDKNPEFARVMREAQRLYHDWHSQSALQRVKGAINTEAQEEARWLGPLERFHADWKDALYPLYKFVKTVYGKEPEFITQDAYKLARLAMGRARKSHMMLFEAAIRPDGSVAGPSLKEILKPVRERIDDFVAYITARRALELNNRGIATGINPADAFAVVRKLDSPEFRKAFEDLQAYQDTLLEHLVDAGILSRKQVAVFKKLNRDYVPFYRFFGEERSERSGGGRTGRRFADLPQAVRRIRGSTRTIINPLENIVKNTIYFIDLADRNRVGRAIADAADKAEGLGWLIEKVPTPKQPTKIQLKRLKKDLIDAGIPEDALDQADLEKIATVFYPIKYARAAEVAENILVVWRSGKPAFYKCHPDLYRALEMLDAPSAHWLVRLLSFPARALRMGAVLNPEFIARNPARDQLTAFIQSRYGFVPVVDLIRGFWHVVRRTDTYKEWVASGGAMSTLTSLDRDYLQANLRQVLGQRTAKERALNVAAAPVKFLQWLSESLEEATRVGEFAKGVKKEQAAGAPEREARLRAAYSSREVSLDFQRAGHKGRQANQIIAFFNAALEGPSALKRTFQRDPVGATIRALALITIPTLALYARNHRDRKYREVYEELPRWRRDLYWCIPTGDGKIYYIPKPFEAGVLFGSFFERALDFVKEKDPKAFKDWLESAATVFSPGFIPTALVPVIEIWSNRSFFTRRPIVPMREQKLQPEEQFGPYTSETAKAIGRMFNVSPRYIEQAVRGYFGGLGMHALNFLDLLSGKALETQRLFEVTPFERAFVGAPFRQAESIEEFYSELDRLERMYNTAKEKLERGEKPAKEEIPDMAKLRRLRAADKYLQKGRQLIRQIQADRNLTKEEKRKKIDLINFQMVNIARVALGKKPLSKEAAP